MRPLHKNDRSYITQSTEKLASNDLLSAFARTSLQSPCMAFHLLHLRDDVDRGGKSQRQASNPHSSADVFPSLAKNLDQKIRRPVHNESLPVKVLGAVDQAMDGDDLLEVIE